MDIVVCIKQVPDTTAKKDLDSDFLLNRAELESVINPFDEYALEEALRLRDSHGGEVTVVTMGPSSAEDTMRKALAMGADKGVLITDSALVGTDWLGTCAVLGAAIRGLPYDLILTGMESTDARSGLVPGGLAEHLGIPVVTYTARLEIRDKAVIVHRQIPGGVQIIEASMPAVISVVKGANEPRYPSLKGIMAAKRKEIKKTSLSDLGLEGSSVGLAGSKTPVLAAAPRPDKAAGEIITPETPEEAANKLADFLQASKFI
ncbi:MAG: electron transfer flavoprotein subunit beta/FixA family protein [Chloroflexota bacterium]